MLIMVKIQQPLEAVLSRFNCDPNSQTCPSNARLHMQVRSEQLADSSAQLAQKLDLEKTHKCLECALQTYLRGEKTHGRKEAGNFEGE